MALPESGLITFNMIKTELGLTGSKSLDDLVQASNLVDKSVPHNISDFYGYTHTIGTGWDLNDLTTDYVGGNNC